MCLDKTSGGWGDVVRDGFCLVWFGFVLLWFCLLCVFSVFTFFRKAFDVFGDLHAFESGCSNMFFSVSFLKKSLCTKKAP